MKYLKYLFIMLLIPFIVLAEECDISKITITSMEQSNIEGNTEEISSPTYQDRSINLNLKMYEVGDSITYDMIIKNESEEDYMIDEDTFKTDSDYIEYTLKTNDNSNVVKANSSKELSLVVTYKKEVEDNLLTNNKYNASNSLNLSLNTSEKEQSLDVITTDNIKESVDPIEVINPVTSVSSMLLIIIILLITTIIAYILITKKNRYTKYLLILLSMVLIPTVYAICKCDIEVESTIEIEKIKTLFDTIADISNEENACIIKYNGEVTDEVNNTVEATNVYFNKCSNKRNIIFNNICWQMIRTTETGGTKMIYNGEPVDGKCESGRPNHTGIVGGNGSAKMFTATYLYANSFTYDISTNSFTLVDGVLDSYLNNSYEHLIGKYTCKNTTGTCTNLYYINGNAYSPYAYATEYIIDDTNYAQIGASPFNAVDNSLANVGYMFNNVYYYTVKNPLTTTYKYGSTFTYDVSTNTYTLSGTTEVISSWNSSYNLANNAHYTCWNETGTCNLISYIYYTDKITAYYIHLKDGKSINDAINEMLYNDDVNKYNSDIKGIIDAWYEHKMLNKTDMLEDTVFCNARDMYNQSSNGWNPNGGNILTNLIFKNQSDTLKDLTCKNETDQFAVSNSKAHLKYPVGLLQNEENANINNDNLMQTGDTWWTISPYYFNRGEAYLRVNKNVGYAYYSHGVRPVISLKKGNTISSGTGSESDPWIIE